MSKFWSPHLKGLTAYEAGEQPQDKSYIKLNTNENPYPASSKVIEKIRDVTASDLALYPDPESNNLRQTVARYYGLEKANIFIGNGSDEVLAHAFMAFFKQVYPVYFPAISYSFYPVYCGYFDIEYREIPLDNNFDIQFDGVPEINGGLIFPNPNAPTGKLVEVSEIEILLQKTRESVVIIDEAYIDFGGQSCVSLVSQYKNLLVIQTTSKSRSLAGLRIGYAMGDPELIQGLSIAKNSFNSYPVDRVAGEAAVAAFLDDDHFQRYRKQIIETRDWVTAKLTQLRFEVVPSYANFLMIGHPDIPAVDLYSCLKEKGILVRYFSSYRIDAYIRVSIGTREDMEIFVQTIEEILRST